MIQETNKREIISHYHNETSLRRKTRKQIKTLALLLFNPSARFHGKWRPRSGIITELQCCSNHRLGSSAKCQVIDHESCTARTTPHSSYLIACLRPPPPRPKIMRTRQKRKSEGKSSVVPPLALQRELSSEFRLHYHF